MIAKPKLTRIAFLWFCSRGPKTYTGIGLTPHSAYRDWVRGGALLYVY